ncbi:MAG: radical SAM protein [Bdellovibrionales bacterium]|nr:radical SAM protein [Bdellovibrionales bacterium]
MKPLCRLPWHGLFLSPDGRQLPCCTFKSQSYGEINSQQILKSVQIDFLNNKIPSGCKSCLAKEKRLGRSLRTQFDQHLIMQRQTHPKNYQFLDDFKYTESSPYLLQIDISDSTNCNLKCRFCGSHASNQWENDQNELAETHPKLFKKSTKNLFAKMTTSEVLSLIEQNPNLYHFQFRGGEPFLNPKLKPILQRLIELDRQDQCIIDITTNGTWVPQWFFDIIPLFSWVNINISLEGTGQTYQYLRGGKFDLERDIKPNLQKLFELKNGFFCFHVLLSAFNIFEIIPTYEWIQSLKLQKNFKWQLGLVQAPKALSLYNLPLQFRQQAANLIPTGEDPILDQARALLLVQGTGNLHDFFEYVQALDQKQGGDFLVTFPYFKDLLESFNQSSDLNGKEEPPSAPLTASFPNR